MSNEPVDLAAIETWYAGLSKPELNEPWAKYIATLLQRVKELETALTAAERTRVRDGGRGQLRPFPEPDQE